MSLVLTPIQGEMGELALVGASAHTKEHALWPLGDSEGHIIGRNMSYPWDQVDAGLCSGNAGCQPEIMGGVKAVLADAVGGRALNELETMRLMWRLALWARKTGTQGGSGSLAKVGSGSTLMSSKTDLPSSGWNIQAVLCGDGTMMKARVPFSEGSIYASGAMVGGGESFWEIEPMTLRVCDQGADILEWPIIAITPTAQRSKSVRVGPRIDLRGLNLAAKRLKVVRELLSWVRNNPGVAVLIGGPGDRSESKRLGAYERPHEGHVVYRASARRCVEAALVNGAERVLGPSQAIDFERQLFSSEHRARKSIKSLRNVQEILHAVNGVVEGKLEVRKISEKDKTSFRSNAFQWLVEEAKGIWIVRLVDSGVADNCVVVDTRVALIFDCAARHPISLTEEALRLCGGDDARNLQVAEVRQLVPQLVSKKRRNSKRARIE